MIVRAEYRLFVRAQCQLNSRAFTKTQLFDSEPSASTVLSGQAIFDAIFAWTNRKKPILYEMAVQLSDIMPLQEGFNMPKRFPVVYLEFNEHNRLEVILIHSYEFEEYLAGAPDMAEIWRQYEMEVRGDPTSPGLVVPIVQCRNIHRSAPLKIRPHARSRASSEAIKVKLSKDWKALLNEEP